jgi:hypothetical protein
MKKCMPAWKSSPLPTAICLSLMSSGLAADVVTFNFDTGTPAPGLGQPTTFDYGAGGMNAHFSSATPAQTFSVEDASTVSIVGSLSLFSGKFLYPDSTARATLDILFSQPLTSINFSFATTQSTAVETPNPITLRAYMNSTANPVVGTPLTVSGSFGSEPMPSGTLSFTAGGLSFNLVEITLKPGGAGGFLLDNLSANAIPEPPVLSVGQGLKASGFELILTSRSGFSYDIQTSTNFGNWTFLKTVNQVNGSFQVLDTAAKPSIPCVFYRAVQR